MAGEPPAAATKAAAPAVTFRADRLEGDLALGEVTLQGGVEVAYDRYRLRSERLRLRLDGRALIFTGEARAALCPCPDPPLTFLAAGGRVVDGDLVLRFPRLAVSGVPVFSLPWLWLRAPDRAGLLPPLIAVRGGDGLLLGSGVHLPGRTVAGAEGSPGVVEGVDLLAGAYVKGGAELGARLFTVGNDASVTADLVRGTRVAVEGRGTRVAEGARGIGLAWAVDAVRGDRARSGTVDLGAAARPFDTAAAEVSWRTEVGPVSTLVAGGAVGRAFRGDGPVAAGPRSTLAFSGRLGDLGSWSAGLSGTVLGGADDALAARTLSLGRASAGVEIDTRPGPFELRTALSGRARIAADGAPAGASTESAVAARADLELPFARTFAGTAPGEAATVHWITPALSLRGALAGERGDFFVPLGGTVPTGSWIAAVGLSTAVGRYAGPAVRLDLRAGATGATDAARALLHARLGADARIAAAAVEVAAVGAPVGEVRDDRGKSAALLGRVRIGALSGPWLRLDAAAQGGPVAGSARAIAAGAWAALPGDDLAYLATSGWTGGTELSIPWSRWLRTSARADVDLDARRLLSIRGAAEVRHPCGCLGLGLLAAHRVGREGVDVALTVDVAPRRGSEVRASPGGQH